MIFDYAKIQCSFEILRTLTKGNAKYSKLRKVTQSSHETLQKCLKELSDNDCIIKLEFAKGYEINDKGKALLQKLEEIKEIWEKK